MRLGPPQWRCSTACSATGVDGLRTTQPISSTQYTSHSAWYSQTPRQVTMHNGTFNADFYVTAATIIPVLFLALTLQEKTYGQLIRRGVRIVNKESASWIESLWLFLYGNVLSFTGTAIVVAGIAGEITAILALYYRTSSPQRLVLIPLLALVIAVGIGPAAQLLVPLYDKGEEQSSGGDSEESPE
jgi:hypothetical protein